KAIVFALGRANLTAVAVDDPNIGLALLNTNQFGLAILDGDLPGMSGFEFCKRLRALPEYTDTPVIFVTALSDFQSRAESMAGSGNDLIAKPFVFSELAVKALIYVMKGRLKSAIA